MVQDHIVGFIPKVVLHGFGYQDNYALFITDKRLVFILTGKGHIMAGALLGGAFGAFVAKDIAKDNFNFSNFDLESKLAENKLNQEIILDRITEVRLKKEWGGAYTIKIFGLDHKNKVVKFINGYFEPPKDLKRYYLKSGYKQKDILIHYARTNQDMLVSALGEKVTVKYFL